MKTVFGILTCLVFAGNAVEEPNKAPADDYDDFVPFRGERHDQFDWRLTRMLLQKDSNNVILSPFSVKLLLTLLGEASGIDSPTQKQLAQILPNIRTPYEGRDLYKIYFNSIMQKSEEHTLDIGTRIFVDQRIETRQRFAAICERYYFAGLEQVDFSKTTEAADKINQWCSNVTKGHISKLVSPDTIKDAMMILLNAIYFKGNWRRPFAANETTELPFHTGQNQQVKVPFMKDTAYYYYFSSPQLKSKILRLPYKGHKYSMNLLLPYEDSSVEELIAQLDSKTLNRAAWLLDEHEVDVQIPKFKFDYTAALNDVLMDLGIVEIFTNNASLPALARGTGLESPLRVSSVLQKSGIIVDEKGSTAYAATEIQLVNKFGDTKKEFIANRPFIFFIEDESTGALLFAGKVTNPQALN